MPALAKHVSFSREPLAVGYHKRDVFLLSRVIHHDGEEELCCIAGTGDTTFSGKPYKVRLKLADGTEEDIRKCHHFKFFYNKGDVTLTYVRDGTTSHDTHSHNKTLVYAGTKDRKTWVVGGTIKEVTTPGILIPNIEDNDGDDAGDVVYYESADLLKAAVSKNLKTWKKVLPPRVPHWHFFEGQPFHIMGALSMEDGIAVFFESTIKVDIVKDVAFQDKKIGEERFAKIGAALFSKDNPTKLIWQTELPLAELPWSELSKSAESFSFLGVVPSSTIGSSLEKEPTARFYVASHPAGENGHDTHEAKVGFFEFPADILHDHRRRIPASLKKSAKNPVIEPTTRSWESGGTFNPTAVKVDDKVHLLYRAVGNDSWSRIGHAESKDGVNFDERSKRPVYSPHEWFESPTEKEDEKSVAEADMIKTEHDHTLFASGGSWGGCEDPKATLIGDRIYMTYVAHNGSWPQRSALTSISVDDFLKKKWKWSKSMLMSPPGVGSKSAVILPEKIDGKFVLFHRIWPDIMIDTVPELEFGEGKVDDGKGGKTARWLTGQYAIRPRSSYWDSRKMSMGAAPIKTDKGWLAIYNAVDKRDSSKYKIGAMLIDLKDPTKVIARCRRPILSPDEWYENNGKPGIAYPGGAVDLDGILHVYYGGGDLVSCVATIGTEEMVWHLLKDRDPKFKLLGVDVSNEPMSGSLELVPELVPARRKKIFV
jgi:predicted GH43/DUF377 family glycosyl hydrolase